MLGMQLAVDFMLRDRFVDILERHANGLFLAGFDYFLDFHAINGKTVLRRQGIRHLQHRWPGTMSFQINRAPALLDFRVILLYRCERGILRGLYRNKHSNDRGKSHDHHEEWT